MHFKVPLGGRGFVDSGTEYLNYNDNRTGRELHMVTANG